MIDLPELDIEQQAWLDGARAAHNATVETPLTEDEYCALVLFNIIDAGKHQAINNEIQRLGEAAKTMLTDAKRLELTELNKAFLLANATP